MKEYANRLSDNGTAIFLFHGVISRTNHLVRNYTAKHILSDQFSELLRRLANDGHPVSIEDIVRAEQKGTPLPSRSFAITFDDGFRNNYCTAAPVLNQYQIPATFYVTTGFVGHDGCSWIDQIEYALEIIPCAELNLPRAGISGTYTTPAEKIMLLKAIRKFAKETPGQDPYELAADLHRQLGVQEMKLDPDLDDKLTYADMRELARNPLFTIGGHGHTHRILEFLSDTDLEEEICTSIDELTQGLGIAIRHYSYPEGLRHCYSDRVIDCLRRHGIVCCPTAEDGCNPFGTDLFRLRRIMVE